MTTPLRRAPDKLLPVDERVEAYLRRALGDGDDALRRIRAEAARRRMPSITPEAGRALSVLARAVGARHALELGTGTGYSGVWLARGLAPGGRLVTVEGNPDMAALARGHFRDAGVGDLVEVREGACLDVVRAAKPGSLDLVFADATKSEYPAYHDAALRALRTGGLLAADNVFWQGTVLDQDPRAGGAGVADADLAGILAFTRLVADERRWSTVLLPFGDGLSVSVKR